MSKKSLPSRAKYFFSEKKWGIAAILIGTAVGFLSAVICVKGHIAIFGFNISFIVSPLIAGYTETYVARKKYGKTTGAISALLIFLLINIGSWVFPKEPISLSIITLGGLGLAFQAAFPILVNYLIFVIFLGTITYVLGYIGNILSGLTLNLTSGDKSKNNDSKDETYDPESIDLSRFNVLAVNTSEIHGKTISKNYGIMNSEYIFKPNLELYNKGSSKDPVIFKQMEFGRKAALAKIMEISQKIGANAIIEIEIDYTDIGGLKGSEIMITASGTAVLIK